MAIMLRAIVILPLLFFSGYGQLYWSGNPFEAFNEKKIMGPHELFGNPFGNPNDYKAKPIPDDFGTLPVDEADYSNDELVQEEPLPKDEPNYRLELAGMWEMFSENSGVSSMHAILLPKVNKVLMYDATIWRISAFQLPPGHCRKLNETAEDCFCHSVLFDIDTGELTPLELNTDTWCSSGGLTVDGNLVSTGGFQAGANTVRYLETCPGCNWREYPTALAAERWYSTQAQLADNRFIVVGGRAAFSYEYIPAEGTSNAKAYNFDFLKQTNNKDENNLYPFVHLSTDGNVFIFANDRAVLLNPKSNKVVRELPVLPGGHRNYPASGMSVLLPIKLRYGQKGTPDAEVLICGGSAHEDAYTKAGNLIFYTALQDCGRIKITDKKAVWKREIMPSPRTMGDMLLLPTGDVLAINGAKRGCSGWGFAREPNYRPVIYNPRGVKGLRFRELAATQIPRMYHSTSTLLPDGKILVAGSNTNNGYIYDAMFPTELRVEKFSPPYLDPKVAAMRPLIVPGTGPERITYGQEFQIHIDVNARQVKKKDIRVTMYVPAFTTHGVSMNQRLVSLSKTNVVNEFASEYTITAIAPPNSKVAPAGYYMLFVVYRGIPSVATWVQIQ